MEVKFLNLEGLSTFLDKIKNIFATKEQGSKADSALQQADIKEGNQNGTVSVKGTNVKVYGLNTAAYASTTDFDAKGSAAAVKEYVDSSLTWGEL